jgi:RimJ/RimL family protein N-acetyltransferase
VPGHDAVILTTERLTLRRLRLDESAVLAVYMNDPDVARYQDWELPRPEAEIAAKIAAYAERRWPCPGSGLNVAVEHDGELVGDVGVGWDDGGVQATIGYTLRAEHQGRGFATEAAGAVVDRLLAEGVRRISATTDPQNLPSMRVLERLGFRHEGTARSAVLIRGEWLDDELFALLPEDRRTWLGRPTGPAQRVELVEITPKIARAVGALTVGRSQQGLVAPVLGSFRDALFPDVDDAGGRLVPWYRAIVADGDPVGFLMIAEATATEPHPFLWRLLVDLRHQRRGIGRRAIEMLIEHVRGQGHARLLVSYEQGYGSPGPFYASLGFAPTGEINQGEVVAALEL